MVKAVITGFGPFPGVPENPSETLVKNLNINLDGTTIVREVIPTEWIRCRDLAAKLYNEHNPDLIIHVGVHSSAEQIHLESTARNMTGSQQDACNACFANEQIEPLGPYQRTTTLPLTEIVKSLAEQNIPANISHDAGDYLCNFLYYQALSFCSETLDQPQALFVHIPDPERQTILSLPQIETALHHMLSTCVDHIRPKTV